MAMTFDELRAEVLADYPTMMREEVVDALGSLVWDIGVPWDRVEGIDSRKCKGNPPRLGTPNHRSWTYKLRKAAGYSYP